MHRSTCIGAEFSFFRNQRNGNSTKAQVAGIITQPTTPVFLSNDPKGANCSQVTRMSFVLLAFQVPYFWACLHIIMAEPFVDRLL